MPSLRRAARWHWDPDPEELWSILVLKFLEVVCDLASTDRRVSVRVLVNRACSRAHEVYKRRWRAMKLIASLDELLERGQSTHPSSNVDLERADLLGGRSAWSWLQELVVHGWLSEVERDLLWATRVEGWTVAEYALWTNERTATVLKRRQRAEERLRKALSTDRGHREMTRTRQTKVKGRLKRRTG